MVWVASFGRITVMHYLHGSLPTRVCSMMQVHPSSMAPMRLKDSIDGA